MEAYSQYDLAMMQCHQFALPGTKKNQLSHNVTTSDSTSDTRSATIKPTNAIPSCLRSITHSNTTQPFCINSCSNSVQSHPNLPSVRPPNVEHPITLDPRADQGEMPMVSPGSITTNDPGFDDMPSLSQVQSNAEEWLKEAWEMDNNLSPHECLKIAQQKSEYERSRSYNIVQSPSTIKNLSPCNTCLTTF